MHILFLTDNFPPEMNAPASRTFEHCREWVTAGHKVTVITCAPNFPKGKLFSGYRNRIWQSEEIAGIHTIRVWSFISANEGFALRIADYLSFMFSAIIAAFFVRRFDVVIGTSPQFFTVVAAWITALIRRKPWVFELRDIWPESIRAVGAMKSSKILDLFEKLELFLYRKADHIVVVTESFRKTLTQRGIDTAKISVVTNGADLSLYEPVAKDQSILQALNLQDKFVVGYIGTHGMAHALETVLEAASIASKSPAGKQIVFLLLGDGARKRHLVEQARLMQLQNVIFLDSVAKDEVAKYWSILDAAVIHLRNVHLFETVIPSKMFEAMAMGIPILLGLRGEAADIIRISGAGICFEPENAQSLAQATLNLVARPDNVSNISEAGRRSAKLFDRKVLADRMLTILQTKIYQK
ncbi:glycosyltransferase family 4 protein [Sphingorhabdus lacus]|jgi:glycosyltransferase involved in cell wall biosynthesis|uniref:Glycosyltransferase WbuB n=1 Tax=Sphingorhabdus lacus TaxID=392610 RepID=A0A6I6LA90_9SPHN|nr:glycosyltransferase family 4 protein [Sphingorhabdus lacus]QGY81311.1 glycosyltransferase WbuB [Sphingorhabdus lacus]